MNNTKALPSTHTRIIHYSERQRELKLSSEKPGTLKINLNLPGQPRPHTWGHDDPQNVFFLEYIRSFSWFQLRTL